MNRDTIYKKIHGGIVALFVVSMCIGSFFGPTIQSASACEVKLDCNGDLVCVDGSCQKPPTTTGSTTGNQGNTAQPTQYILKIDNPIGVSTLEDLIGLIGTYIFNISIPIAVIIIIYGGIMMLLGGYEPKYFTTGKTALTNAVIGLAIIFIGKGFVSLIESILALSKGP